MTKTVVSNDGSGVLETLAPVSEDANWTIQLEEPFVVKVSVEGAAPLLFHRWSVDAIEEKAKAKKGSTAKKTDNIESYVYRNEKQQLSIPGEYLRMSIIGAARFLQDPRSPRKSAMDLFKAGVTVLDELSPISIDGKKTTKDWDYLDRRRVMVQRNGITRARPAFKAGWQASFLVQVLLPEYIEPRLLNETVQKAGRLIGLGDFRPTFGRFNITEFKLI